MASPLGSLLLLALLSSALVASSAYTGRRIGGRTDVRDVDTNKEVQDLGRFSVEEYNRRHDGSAGSLLAFFRVVAAQRQVVSGFKYYLQVVAAEGPAGAGEEWPRRTYDAIVVVKPWLGSRTLVSFTPSHQEDMDKDKRPR